MEYPVETFSAAERARLEAHVTNLDRPVFALVNLPETVKGALFARYSRYPGTLRRLFLDEFAGSLDADGPAATYDNAEGSRAADFYERIFVGYGDDSIAQLGGAHVACEWVSNVLTKVLQRPRLGAYLEQSTRYIAYDAPIEGTSRYRYHRDAELGPQYEAAMDEIFGIYSAALPKVQAWAAEQYPPSAGESPQAHARAIKAKALDLLRGLLPAASLSHMGIFATGQTYEQLILHLLAHPLPEARHYGRGILDAVQAVMPSFVSRVERPDRGGAWVSYLEQREQAAERWVARLGLDRAAGDDGAGGPSVRLVHHDGDETLMLCALLFEASATGERTAREAIDGLDDETRGALLAELMGGRANRRHRPGRGLEALRYRFEIVSDYGAFRDLQRHRMLTCQWQALTPDLGAGVPHELEDAGVAGDYRHALDVSQAAYERLLGAGHDRRAAMYALCLGYRLRYVLDLNAREAMQLIELRSGREGHPLLSGRRACDARADRRGPSVGRGRDDPSGPGDRAAPGAHRVRAANAGQARCPLIDLSAVGGDRLAESSAAGREGACRMSEGDRATRTSKLGSLAVRSEREGEAQIIELIGELDLDGAPRLEEALGEAEASDATSIVVDLGGLEFIDSTGLRLLVMAAERSKDGRFSLLRGPKQVHRVFEITDLVDRLPFAD